MMTPSSPGGEGYRAVHRRSLEDPAAFWSAEARLIHWNSPWEQVCDYSNPPFVKWFPGGTTNLCFNAVDRHLAAWADHPALITISTETNETVTLTFRELYQRVNAMAAVLRAHGVTKGDRVLIYLPNIAEGPVAMLACVRIGAIHSVVFGGFAAPSLATRIDDCQPKLIVSADAGMRGGKIISYKPLLDEAIRLAKFPPKCVLLFSRGLDLGMNYVRGRDIDLRVELARHESAEVPVEWVDATHPSYILYTSGTTGTPKGIVRDTGGSAVALMHTMQTIYPGNAGEPYFCTSDIGWQVGHSYGVYGTLMQGMTSILYEGLPIRPDAGVWWKIVQDYRAVMMFTSPTAIRVLRRQDPAFLKRYDTSSLRYLYLAGEPLDVPTSEWIESALNVPVIDNYWQTETGWPILAGFPGSGKLERKLGSPGLPCAGYDVMLIGDESGPVTEENGERKGVLAIRPPLPPGCFPTLWQDDARFVQTYFQETDEKGAMVYTTFDWATMDEAGFVTILGRADDIINVAGHRLGTREIEEALSAHPAVAECAVVGVKDELKGQAVFACVVIKAGEQPESDAARAALVDGLKREVDTRLGSIARPNVIHFLTALPKTRSGKILRRGIRAIAEGRDPGDLSTLEDVGTLDQVRAAV